MQLHPSDWKESFLLDYGDNESVSSDTHFQMEVKGEGTAVLLNGSATCIC